MNPEDEVRDLLGRARTDAETSEQEWEAFMYKAHRSLAVRRGLLAAAAVVLIGGGVAAGAVLTNDPFDEPEPFSPAGTPSASVETEAEEPAPPEVEVQPRYGYPGPTADASSVVQVWFLDGEQLTPTYRDVGDAEGIGRAAMEALIAGPDGAEEMDEIGSVIPEGTRLLGLTIEEGTATVDLSAEFNDTGLGTCCEHLPLAQVVWTLTQFDTVERVIFWIEGERVEMYGGHGLMIDKPQTRKHYEDAAPAIVVDSPFPGQQVGTTFDLEGNANVYEANVSWRVVDDQGDVLAERFATATCGTGCRGTYRVTVSVNVPRETDATLEVFESSAEDGSPLNMVQVPITIVP